MIMEDDYYCTGGEAEIREYHRKIDFGENAVKEKYNVLIPEYQEIVYRVLRELADGREYFGYNFSRFLKSYKKAEPSVSQLRISRLLLKILGDGVSTSEKEVNNRLDIAKKTIVIKKSADGQTSQIEDFVRDICNYFLIDTDLLEKGIGKVAYIKDEWDCKYRESDLFTGLTEDDISTSFDLRLHIKMYEKYLWEKGELKEGESILEEEWAVMTYTGMFLMLEQQKSTKNEAKAIERLINELYVRQLVEGKMPSLLKNTEF